MAQESQNKTTGRPFQVVEETWSVDTAEHWVFRSYLPQTLAGVIRSLFDAAEQSEMELGIAYVPRSMQTHLKWWPETAAGESTLLISNEKGEWTETKQTFNGRSQVGRDLWMLWHGKQGCALAVATRATAQRAVKIDLPETWQLRMSWFPDNVGNAVGAMKSLLKRHKVLYKQLTAFEEKLDSDRTLKRNRHADSLVAHARRSYRSVDAQAVDDDLVDPALQPCTGACRLGVDGRPFDAVDRRRALRYHRL